VIRERGRGEGVSKKEIQGLEKFGFRGTGRTSAFFFAFLMTKKARKQGRGEKIMGGSNLQSKYVVVQKGGK